MIGRWLTLLASSLAGLALLAMALLTLADVVGRNLLRSPVPGATELTEIGLVAITFLLYPLIAWQQRHITVDLLDQLARPAMRRLMDVFGAMLGAAVFGGMAWQLWKQADRITGYGDVTPSLRLPLGPVIYFMAAASAVTAIAFLLAALRTARGRRARAGAPKPGGYE